MIKEMYHAIKGYPILKEKYEKLEVDLLRMNNEKKCLDNQIKLKDNQIKKIHMKYLETEENRRKSASKAGGLQTSLNRANKEIKLLTETIDKLKESLNVSNKNIDDARILIQSLNKEIRRLKKKPDLTMENLLKYERTRRSPQKIVK